MWSLMRSNSASIMSSEFDSSQGSIMVSSEASTGPSRLDSFSSSGGFVQSTDFTMQTSFDDAEKIIQVSASPLSSSSSHGKLGVASNLMEPASTTTSTTDHSSNDKREDDELEIVKGDRAVSPTIQKWVDESCVQTERLKSSGGLATNLMQKGVDDEEIGVEENPASDFALQQALEYSLRAVSPNFIRAGSLDGGFASLGDFQSQLTPTESMLLGLGFGGPDLGIPVRFLKSWREQVIKRKITELQGLLGRSRKSPSPTGSARQYNPQSVEMLKHKATSTPKQTKKSSSVDPEMQEHAKDHNVQPKNAVKSFVKPSEKQLQLEKLKTIRQHFRRSATFSSFSPNSLPDVKHLNGKDHRKKGAMSEKKYQKFRGATRGNAKDRRRVFGTRQSSLPISLETLPEEDELTKPSFLQQKSNSLDLTDDNTSADASTATSVNSSQLDVTIDGNDEMHAKFKGGIDKLERLPRIGPKIVTSRPSTSSLLNSGAGLLKNENQSHEDDKLDDKYDGKHLLVIKQIIESKDSGFGNDISNCGSPQLSPEHKSQSSFTRLKSRNAIKDMDEITNKACHGDTEDHKRQTETFDDEQMKVDLCIQCDFTDSDSCESYIEYSSAGVQTSPWLHSGDLSPLYCVEESKQSLSEEDSTNIESLSLKITCKDDISQFPDGFNSEKRRLSRIEEVTEGTISYQSEEDKVKPSLGSVQDSSHAVSTGSSSRPSSGLIVSDSQRNSEDTQPDNAGQRSPYDFKKLRKKIYKEMLDRNSERDLMHQEKLVQMRAKYQHEVLPGHLTVDETLLKAAEKLEWCLKENQLQSGRGDDDNDLEQLSQDKHEHLTNISTSYQSNLNPQQFQQTLKSTTTSPYKQLGNIDMEYQSNLHPTSKSAVTSPQEQPGKTENKDQIHLCHSSKSTAASPNEQLGSLRSRHFFASNSFLSFTENVTHAERSRSTSESDVSDVASFFSVPVNFESSEGEFDVNFSLTGSDMNLVGGEDNYSSSPDGDSGLMLQFKQKSPVVEDSYKMLKTHEDVTNLISSAPRPHFKDMPLEPNVEKDLSTKVSKVMNFTPSDKSGAFYESGNSPCPQECKHFTEAVEIKVPPLHQENSWNLSQCFIALQPLGYDQFRSGGSDLGSNMPRKYSSKYYFSVDNYSDEPDDEIFTENDGTLLSKRRQSLINAHLSAKMHVFDEFVCENYSSGDCWSSSEELTESPMIIGASMEGGSADKTIEVATNLDSYSFMKDKVVQERACTSMDDVELNQKKTVWDKKRVGGSSYSRLSNDSQTSIGSSITSSKVDQYVDKVLENVLDDVRCSEAEKLKLDKKIMPIHLGQNQAIPCGDQENDSWPQEMRFCDGLLHFDQINDKGTVKCENQTPYQPSRKGKQAPGRSCLIKSQQKQSDQTMDVLKGVSCLDMKHVRCAGYGQVKKSSSCNGHHVDDRMTLTVSVNGKKVDTHVGDGSSMKGSSYQHSLLDGGDEVGKPPSCGNVLDEGPVSYQPGLRVIQQHENDKGTREIGQHGYIFAPQTETSRHLPMKGSELLLSYEQLCAKAQDLISNMDAFITGKH